MVFEAVDHRAMSSRAKLVLSVGRLRHRGVDGSIEVPEPDRASFPSLQGRS